MAVLAAECCCKATVLFGVFVSMLLLISMETRALVVLQYHHISDRTPPSTSTRPLLFQQHLKYLKKHDFRIISIETLAHMLRQHRPLPDKAAVITFDDGYRSIYTEAFPRLKSMGWPFTVFINSQAHDENRPSHMSWAELKELSSHGATIANHSRHHPFFLRRDTTEASNVYYAKEVGFVENRLKKEIGKTHKLFAYPYGEYDSRLADWLKENGYLAFGQHSGPMPNGADHQKLPRFPFGGQYGDITDFALKVNSVAFPQMTFRITGKQGNQIHEPELPPGDYRPTLQLEFAKNGLELAKLTQCFATKQGRVQMTRGKNVLYARAKMDLAVGRTRYNCTARRDDGRFYWWSTLFIRRGQQGAWQHQ